MFLRCSRVSIQFQEHQDVETCSQLCNLLAWLSPISVVRRLALLLLTPRFFNNPNLNPNSNANPNPTPQAVEPSVRWQSVYPNCPRWHLFDPSVLAARVFRASALHLYIYTPCVALWVSMGAHERLWIPASDPWVPMDQIK